MSRYRKIDPRFWKDEKVMSLAPEEKLIALYLFTGQSNRIGIFNFSPGEAAEDLRLEETFRKGFEKVCETLNFGWDKTFRVLYLPTWWKYNSPENPNVLKSCLADLHEIPQTPLINQFSSNLTYLPETFHQTFREGLGKPCPKRMAHQEQKQEQNINPVVSTSSPVKKPGTTRAKRKSTIPTELKSTIERVIAMMNDLAGSQYEPDSKIVFTGLVSRLQGGKSEDDCICVVKDRWREWGSDPKMRQHFNPETLFREGKFDKYLNAARMKSASNGAGGFVG